MIPMTELDPISVAIEACRKAQQYFERSFVIADLLGKDFDAHTVNAMAALQDAFKEVAETAPTTTAGLAERIVFIEEARERHPSAFDEVEIFPALAIAAKRLMRV
jgi:hypothetical protein